MNGLARVAIAGALGTLLLSTAAAAQTYGPGDTSSTSSTSSSTSSTTASLPPEAVVGDVEPQQAQPGDEVTAQIGGDLPPGAEAEVSLLRAREGAPELTLGDATVGSDGTVSFTFDIPEGTPAGIYFVVVVVDGQRFIAVVVVTDTNGALVASAAIAAPGSPAEDAGGSDAAQPAAAAPAAGASVAPAPAPAAAPAALLLTESEERALLDDVEDGAVLEIADGGLIAQASDEEPSGAAIVALSAAGVAALGLAGRRVRRSRLETA